MHIQKIYILLHHQTKTKMKTTKQIQKEVIKKVKSICSKNEIIKINIKGDDSFGMVTVEMESTCEVGEIMIWNFVYDYDAGNEDMFEPYELTDEKYSKYIQRESLIVKQI